MSVQAESFTIVSAKKAQDNPLFPPAIIKKYTTIIPVNTTYAYFFSDTQNRYILTFSFDEKDTSFNDLLQNGVEVDNLKDINIKKSGILDQKPPINCSFEGRAKVEFKEIWMVIPEFASEINTGSTISKISAVTKPKKNCYN